MGNLIFNSKDSMQNLIKLENEAAEAVGKVLAVEKEPEHLFWLLLWLH